MGKARWLLPALGAAAGFALYAAVRGGHLRRLSAEGESYWETSAEGYDRAAGRVMAGLYDRIAREASSACREGEALDAGCGPGHVALRLAEVAPALRVTGLDLSPAMIERANLHARERGLAGRVSFQVGDVLAMPFPDERFDLVVSSFSLHHWGDAARGLAEIYRVLKPGGQARIFDLPDWVRRNLHGEGHGPTLSRLAASSPFGTGVVAVVRWPDGLPTVRCLHLRR